MVTDRQPVAVPDRTPARDGESVYRLVTVVASHPESWADAAALGIAQLAKTITDLRVARVLERDTVLRLGKVVDYRVKLQVSFRIDARRLIDGTPTTVRRYLVVANETVSAPTLLRALVERLDAGPAEFHLLAPLKLAPRAGTTLVVRPWTDHAVRDERSGRASIDRARQRAEARLAPLADELRDRGATVTWEVALTDPASAVAAVLDRAAIDEVIVSTLPSALSRWARLDLPRRLGRRCGLPVTVVESEL